jgi:S-formylglutathione hydrolase FrmB
MYAAAASFSGTLDIAADTGDIFESIESGLASDIFGDRNTLKGSLNDLFAAAEHVAHSGHPSAKLYMWCGTGDFLYQANLHFRDQLHRLNLPLIYEESPGDHQWKNWDACIKRLLEWLQQG